MNINFSLSYSKCFSVYWCLFVLSINIIRISRASNDKGDERQWISSIISTGMLTYTPYGVDNLSLCSIHGRLIEIFASNYTVWALRMIDSSSKGPSGLMYGNDFDFGHFDECISTSAFNNTLKGQYMIVSLSFNRISRDTDKELSNHLSDQSEFLQQNDSYWNLIEYSKLSKAKRIRRRDRLNWALCVPDSCSSNDILYSVNKTLAPFLKNYDLTANITLLEEFTYSRFEKSWTIGSIIFVALLLQLCLIVLLASLYDLVYKDKKNIGRLEKKLMKFSILYNISHLCKTDGTISVISGMKVISMCLIIYGHRMLITMFSPIHNTYDNEIGIGQLLNTYYLNGILIVDTFLVITGFLSFNKMLKSIDKYDDINIIKLMFRRYMRLTPTYGLIIAFEIWIHPYLEGGPLARNVIWDSSECSEIWWTNLLYINNYLYSEKQCFIPSWYLAADMQLYVFCSLIAFIIWKIKRFTGLTVLIASLLLSIVMPAAIIVIKGYTGATFLYLSDFASYFRNMEFIETYLQTHFRATPYIIGMLAAYVYRKIESSYKNALKIRHKYWMGLLAIVQIISMNVSILSAWWFYVPASHYSILEVTFYTVLHRLGWAIPIAWIIVIHSSRLYEPFRKVLGLSIFQPLNNLSYSVFLIHTPLQLYLAGQNRSPVYFNWLTSWWMAAGDIVLSYGAAIILYLVAEAPLMNLLNG